MRQHIVASYQWQTAQRAVCSSLLSRPKDSVQCVVKRDPKLTSYSGTCRIDTGWQRHSQNICNLPYHTYVGDSTPNKHQAWQVWNRLAATITTSKLPHSPSKKQWGFTNPLASFATAQMPLAPILLWTYPQADAQSWSWRGSRCVVRFQSGTNDILQHNAWSEEWLGEVQVYRG